jgi:hypothetical protein
MNTEDKLEELIGLLEISEKLASEFSGGHSNRFLSAEEFHAALSKSLEELEGGNISEINKLYYWFAPTGDWDDLIGEEGQSLANEIFELLSVLRKEFDMDADG